MSGNDDAGYIDYGQLTDGQRATLDGNEKIAKEVLAWLMTALREHREENPCPGYFCSGAEFMDILWSMEDKPHNLVMLIHASTNRILELEQELVRRTEEA